MREVREVREEVIKNEVIAITCNRCGKVESGEHIEYESTIQRWSHSFGYGSKFDTDTVDFDLCDDCVEAIFKEFKNPPKFQGSYND